MVQFIKGEFVEMRANGNMLKLEKAILNGNDLEAATLGWNKENLLKHYKVYSKREATRVQRVVFMSYIPLVHIEGDAAYVEFAVEIGLTEKIISITS